MINISILLKIGNLKRLCLSIGRSRLLCGVKWIDMGALSARQRWCGLRPPP